MDRALTEYNTVLHQKWITENKKLHKKGVRDQSSRVDNKLPEACKYPIVKSKKELIIEGKN
jgi:hypothetical protein